MKLGILLTTSPENENTHTVIEISKAALSQGKKVSIFLMADGVYNVNHSAFMELAGQGAEIIVCAYNASQRKVEIDESISGSQYDLALIAEECDKFISFN